MERDIKLFHFFAWSDAYGWQHLGSTDGYTTIEECKRDNKFHVDVEEGRSMWKIMKLEVIEEKIVKQDNEVSGQ